MPRFSQKWGNVEKAMVLPRRYGCVVFGKADFFRNSNLYPGYYIQYMISCLVWGHLCTVLGTVTEKAGLTYSLTKLRPVD